MTTIGGRKKTDLSWEEKIVRLKMMFPKLTNADLNYPETAKFEMYNRLEFKLAMTAKEINEIIETP